MIMQIYFASGGQCVLSRYTFFWRHFETQAHLLQQIFQYPHLVFGVLKKHILHVRRISLHYILFSVAKRTLTPSRVIIGIKDTLGTREFVISPYLAKSSFPLPVFEHFFIDSRSTGIRLAHVFIIPTGSMLFSIMQDTNCSCTDGSLMTSMEQACTMFA